MIRKYLLPLLAVAGFALAAAMVIQDNRVPPAPPPAASPKVPFSSYVVGAGILEASTGNIAIGTPVPGIVTAIYVKRGDRVTAGAPLFKIDDRDMQGQLLPVVAKAKEAEANLAKTRNLLKIAERLSVGRSISAVEKENRRYDLAIGKATLGSIRAQIRQIEIEIDRRTVRAPVAGRILAINIKLGEFAESAALSSPLMLLGDDTRLFLRVSVDENDAWRVQANAPAIGVVRGNPDLITSLKFERFEPFVIPKPSFTGVSSERTDTRVLQVIYSFDHAALPVYVGQEMDAYIKALPVPEENIRPPHKSGKPS